MSFSKLATVFIPSPNRNKQRTEKVIYFTPHCMVGQMTAKRCGELFARSSYQASSNYGIGTNGEIAGYVDEEDRSWCTSSAWNDNRAITVECASDTKHPYAMNQKVWDALVALGVDICQRYGKNKMLWFNDKKTTLNYIPKSDEMVITVHRWFAAKACPGDWLYNRLGKFADEVNAKLSKSTVEVNKIAEYPKTGIDIPTEDDRAYFIWNYLSKKGLNDYAVAGLMGNLQCESALRPNNLQNSFEIKEGWTDKSYTKAVNDGTYANFIHDKAGYGLAQWTWWSRKQALLYFAEKRMVSIDDLKMQLDFLWEELGAYGHVMKVLTKANSIKEASNVVLREYEKPAVVVNNDKSGITKALNARTTAGKEFYDKFSANSKAVNVAELNYYIQYGAFGSKNNAKKRLYEVKNKGLEAEIEKFDGYYRVRSQYYDGVTDLLNAEAARARKAGFNILIKSR
jgi:hypothetical protein